MATAELYVHIPDPPFSAVTPHLCQIYLVQAGAAVIIRLYEEKSFISGSVFNYNSTHMHVIDTMLIFLFFFKGMGRRCKKQTNKKKTLPQF